MLIIATEDKGSACGIVIYRHGEEDIEILLAKQKTREFWELPKGRSMSGESPEETAKREVEEEVGIQIEDMEHLRSFSGRKGRQYHFFYAEMDAEPDVDRINEEGVQEFVNAQYFPLVKALRQVVKWQRPCIEDLASLLIEPNKEEA